LIPYYSTPSGLLDSDKGLSVSFAFGGSSLEQDNYPRLGLPTLYGLQDLQATMEGIFVSTPNPPFLNLNRSHGNAQGF
jgi:hypothetical protein